MVHVYNEKKQLAEVLQLLMAFSSSGILTNTFSHELSRISEKVGDRMLHIKCCIDDMLDYKEYSGDETFNPYIVIDDSIKNDEVLQSWINIIMKAVEKGTEVEEVFDLAKQINDINIIWNPLISKKKIKLTYFNESDFGKYFVSIAKIDLFTIINNLNLNSAWFLEQGIDIDRCITYSIEDTNDKIILKMINNGPALDKAFERTPNVIFEPRITSKGDTGTGLGLWIVKQIINKYNAQINVLPLKEGFGLEVVFDKEVKIDD